ncbi:hypothetical protein H6F98_12565 [Microcoleus sp. FACHB-SPT15]|uniref:Pepco domain-containing protein n=1 Tax=Microcoleus sp. FACHB-SPT15 TaxID=2692830 RepID=UPI00177D0C95|nr:hypothetical protein [Microcoleus sp. FACHB-SPT15]MBD1806280.1 hypothetical protein [Microcoleus sp. FACHB-SPT15]
MSEESTIWIVAEEISESTSVSGAKESVDIGGSLRGKVSEKVTTVVTKRVPIDAVALKAQMSGLLKVVGELFDQAEQQSGMKLNEVQLSVEINAEGQVSLVGTGGKVANKGGITLKFTRP